VRSPVAIHLSRIAGSAACCSTDNCLICFPMIAPL
jgi:hypothetical protein